MLGAPDAMMGRVSGIYGNPNFPSREVMEASIRNQRDGDIRRAAESARQTSQSLEDVVGALQLSLEVARNAKADADRAQRLTTRLAVISLAVAVASLAAAVAAIVVH